MKAPSCDSYILPQKLFSFTDIYPNTQGKVLTLERLREGAFKYHIEYTIHNFVSKQKYNKHAECQRKRKRKLFRSLTIVFTNNFYNETMQQINWHCKAPYR